MNIITVENIHKHYENVHAVKGISFTVKENAFFALLGQNGAGKSTTIEMISTLIEPSKGSIKVKDYLVGTDDAAIRKTLGVVFQYSVLDGRLSVYENLKTRAAFYGYSDQVFKERLETLDQIIHFKPYINRQVMTLSGGQRRKADLARALLHQPSLLILDEPTTGLDPKSRKEIWDLILTLKNQNGMTIFLTTHYMDEVLDADHVIILDEGEIKAEDSADALRLEYASDTIKIHPKEGLIKRLDQDKISYVIRNKNVHIELNDPFEGIEVVKTYREDIDSFEIVKANMDDVFLNITGKVLGEES